MGSASPAESSGSSGCVAITWLRQAGFLVQGRTGSVLFDPFLTDLPGMLVPPARTPEAVAEVSVVLGSHEHADHVDLPAWQRIAAASDRPVFVLPAPVRETAIAAGLEPSRVIGARVDTPIVVGEIRIHSVPARHGIEPDDAYDFGFRPPHTEHRYLGYVVELDGVRLYHAGDTIAYDGMVERLRAMTIDIAFLPINGRDFFREEQGVVGNLTHREAADLAAAIGLDLVVPMHYETVPGNTESAGVFVDYLRRTHPTVASMIPGQAGRFSYCPPALHERPISDD